MKIKYWLAISLILNVMLIYFCFHEPRSENQIPPWHPFELNSNLTLESLVEDGYRFSSMPCGQVQYVKQLGDTTIQYEVTIDCNDYSEAPDQTKESKFTQPKGFADYRGDLTWEQALKANPYYPWDLAKIKDCYERVHWRIFSLNLGQSIDSLLILNYVKKYGAYMDSSMENWNSKEGGSFMAFHTDSELYFKCSIIFTDYEYKEPSWQFQIVTKIPHLSHSNREKEEQYQSKRKAHWSD
ncbi:MAG: hypothetical protein AB8B53_15020 [Flavobacteriales bacterium]